MCDVGDRQRCSGDATEQLDPTFGGANRLPGFVAALARWPRIALRAGMQGRLPTSWVSKVTERSQRRSKLDVLATKPPWHPTVSRLWESYRTNTTRIATLLNPAPASHGRSEAYPFRTWTFATNGSHSTLSADRLNGLSALRSIRRVLAGQTVIAAV